MGGYKQASFQFIYSQKMQNLICNFFSYLQIISPLYPILSVVLAGLSKQTLDICSIGVKV